MKRLLSIDDVQALVDRAPNMTDVVLVGGQALNYWAEIYAITDRTQDGPFGAALSADIDFLGDALAAQALSRATGGRLQLAGQESAHSPNTAVVMLHIDGEEYIIDFLGHLKGFTPASLKTLRRYAVPLPDHPVETAAVRVMHPMHCLESQLENVYGTALDRRDEPGGERHIKRVRLAIEVCRQAVLHYLEAQDARSARLVIEHTFKLAGQAPAQRARRVDDLVVALDLLDETRLGEAFLTRRLPQLRAALAEKTRKHEVLAARRNKPTKTRYR